ncbi:GPP34 family phosphoprotein [Curtobacterium sp. 9128]|uniref:GOLPH3/VPS74 family protein n=1 Tax=Curtobacterium sp. 9128 TaxID=1793722 RepID=UPI0011A6793E|nr:GPP34 family phosphoprotein [Curtobacterium sp. 9128]
MAEQLTVPQAFALLLTGIDGRRDVDGSRFDSGLAGAVLADLALRGAVELAQREVRVIDGASTGSTVLDTVVARIAAASSPRGPKWWVRKLGGRDLRDGVYAELVDAGVLLAEQRTTLRVFTSTVYRERDGRPEHDLRTSVLAVLDGRTAPTPSAAAVIGLLDATGTLRRQFGKVDRARVRDITSGTWASAAVRQVLRDVQTAIMVAGVTAASAATTSSS